MTTLTDHAVLIGHGRVGSLVAEALEERQLPYLVVEEREEIVDTLRARGVEVIFGNAAEFGVLKAANLAGARWFISAIPSPFENGDLVEQARAANPNLEIIARAHSDAEVDHLKQYGASLIIMGEREIARGMTEYILNKVGGASPHTGDHESRSSGGVPVSPVRP